MSCHGRTRSRGCGAGLRGGRLGGTSPVGAEMELGDEDAVGRMATVGSGPVSCLLSQPPRPRASLGRTERWGLLSAKPPGPKQEDTRRGEQQAGPCPPLPDSPASGTARAISQQRKLRLRDSLLRGHQGCGTRRGIHVAGSSPSPQPRGRQRRPCRPLPAHGSSCISPAQGAAASSPQAACYLQQLPRPPSPWGGSVVSAGCFLPTAAPPSPQSMVAASSPQAAFCPRQLLRPPTRWGGSMSLQATFCPRHSGSPPLEEAPRFQSGPPFLTEAEDCGSP